MRTPVGDNVDPSSSLMLRTLKIKINNPAASWSQSTKKTVALFFFFFYFSRETHGDQTTAWLEISRVDTGFIALLSAISSLFYQYFNVNV